MQIASTILYVDDEKHETKYFQKALRDIFEIETAHSVDSAINILDEKHSEIAVVITDQRMPKQPGLELLQHTQNRYPNIIRMLTTAYCDFDSAVASINEAEVFRYIPKPWDLDKLETALHQALSRFQTHQADSGNTLKKSILTELKDDCEHWLMYAVHAYGDADVYRSGVEALACRYNVLINKSFDKSDAKGITAEMDKIISENFLNDAVLEDLDSQKYEGFGVTSSLLKTH